MADRSGGTAGARAAGGRHMRRALVIAVAAAALLLAAQSAARVLVKHRFEASLQGGVNNAGLELNAYFKKGVPKNFTDLQWFNVACPTGGATPFYGVQKQWTGTVNDKGKFNETHPVKNGSGATVHITGTFGQKNGKATLKGTFQLKNLPSCPAGTGKLDYNARQI
jgi:opacity protein-like surface antigen